MPRPSCRSLFALALVAAVMGCYTDPNKQLDQMQANLALNDALNEITARTTEVQFTLDSLRGVVARQDSTLATLANLAGVRYSR